jgi:hypothetical protein
MIAPWAVVIVSSLGAIWHYATSPRSTPETLVFPDPGKPWEFVLLFSFYGIPTAYLSLIVFLPFYYMAARLNVVSYWTMIAAGLVTCLPAALFYGRPQYVFARTLVFLLPFGAAVAVCFLWIIRRGAEPGAAPSRCPPTHVGSPGVTQGPPSLNSGVRSQQIKHDQRV